MTVFTDHKGHRVQTTNVVKVFRAPSGKSEWIGAECMVLSKKVTKGVVMLSIEKGRPKGYNDRLVYLPPEYLEWICD